LDNINHLKLYIHLQRSMCSLGNNCQSLDEEHYSKFSHPEVRDWRKKCNEGANCSKKNQILHIREYFHAAARAPMCASKNLSASLSFINNRDKLLAKINSHNGGRLNVPREIRDWVRSLRLAHRCK
jgi:hypothetical protein